MAHAALRLPWQGGSAVAIAAAESGRSATERKRETTRGGEGGGGGRGGGGGGESAREREGRRREAWESAELADIDSRGICARSTRLGSLDVCALLLLQYTYT
ncbi:hypothetical protein HZH68_006700 [Vespula germanica]|uniref:Uncharacterized protein n=1 Tax=Vespula germanica TaxID=30212 RepID=A0A834KH42_VESGE|nr:hypothetical protein HZH68_006700 [Vespula germanica]